MDRKLDALLYALMQNMMIALSGEKLARDLGVSHSTLARWIDKLRQAGMDIRGELERVRDGGGLVVADVDGQHPTAPGRLLQQHDGRVGRHLQPDTQQLHGDHGHNVPEGTIIIAEAQTEGRGRLGRAWHSEREAGLYFSIVLYPKTPPSLAPLFTLATAVAMHNAIERDTRLDVDIKWPNDLLIDNRKVCGILSEIHAEVDLVKTMILGVGVNVNHERLPADIAQRATSLRIASGRIQSRIEILLEFLEEFENLYMGFERKGPRTIIEHWMQLSSFANGRKIEVHNGVRQISGVTRGLNPLGALRIEQKDGHIEEVYSGDVVKWE